MHTSVLRLTAISCLVFVVSSAHAGDAVLDGFNLSVDSPNYDAAANVFVTDVIPNGGVLEVTVELHDNKLLLGRDVVRDVEGDLLLTVSKNLDVIGAQQVGGDGTFADLVVEPSWAQFEDVWALGQVNTYRLDVVPDLSSDGPFVVDAILVVEGVQPFGYTAEVTRFESRDAFGFYYDGDFLERAPGGDLALMQAFEVFDEGEHVLPVFMMSVVEDDVPVKPPPPLRSWDQGGWVPEEPTAWDGVVDVEVCFQAFPTWHANGTGGQGDRRPMIQAWTSGWCDDGLPSTLCYHDPQPMKRMRVYVYEEVDIGGSYYLQIPDGYVDGPGPVYTDEDGCARIWISWPLVQQDFPEVSNDDYPDLFIATHLEGGHPSLTGGSPETEEPVFEISGAFFDGIDSTYIDNVAYATPTMPSIGSATGYFGGDASGTAWFTITEPYDENSTTQVNARTNLFLIATESFEVAYDKGVTQAFACTTQFPAAIDGEGDNDCAEDRLKIAYDNSGHETSRYRRVGPEGSSSVNDGPLIYISTDNGYVHHNLAHELGHHIHGMAYKRERFSITYASRQEGTSSWWSGFDCIDNQDDAHRDWCPEFQSSTTSEGWADFWSGVTWFDADAENPFHGDSDDGGSSSYYKLDRWPVAMGLAGCDNAVGHEDGGVPVDGLMATHLEALVRQMWWDLYDVDDGAAGTTETLNDPANALRFVDNPIPLGAPIGVPRDQTTLELYEMVDAWEVVAEAGDELNGSFNEKGSLSGIRIQPFPSQWSDWPMPQPQVFFEPFYEDDPDSPNLADWLEALYWVTGDTEDYNLAAGYLMESGCLWSFDRN